MYRKLDYLFIYPKLDKKCFVPAVMFAFSYFWFNKLSILSVKTLAKNSKCVSDDFKPFCKCLSRQLCSEYILFQDELLKLIPILISCNLAAKSFLIINFGITSSFQ